MSPSAAEKSCLVGNPVWFHFLNQVLRDGAQGQFCMSLSVSGIATEFQAILCILFIHSLQSHQDVAKKVIAISG